jgi:hypothetical protein
MIIPCVRCLVVELFEHFVSNASTTISKPQQSLFSTHLIQTCLAKSAVFDVWLVQGTNINWVRWNKTGYDGYVTWCCMCSCCKFACYYMLLRSFANWRSKRVTTYPCPTVFLPRPQGNRNFENMKQLLSSLATLGRFIRLQGIEAHGTTQAHQGSPRLPADCIAKHWTHLDTFGHNAKRQSHVFHDLRPNLLVGDRRCRGP